MKRQLIFSTVSFLVILLPGSARARALNAYLRSGIYSNLVTGATDYSILQEGALNTHEVTLNYRQDLGGLSLNGGLAARLTNDHTSYGDENFNLQRWFIGMDSSAGPLRYGFTGGDVFGSFSDLVFSRSLTGALGYFKVGGLSIEPIYGRQYAAVKDSAYERNSAGLRVSQEFSEKLSAGFSYALTADNSDSLSENTGDLTQESNTVYGIDINSRLSDNVSLHFDIARALYREALSGMEEEDNAYRLRADYRVRDFRASGEYSVAGSSFSSLSGYADRDRKVTAVSAGYRWGALADTRFSYETYSNNINGDLDYTTIVKSPRFRADLRLRPNAFLNFDYRLRAIESDDRNKTVDRNFISRSAGMRYVIGTSNFNINYALSNNADEKDSGNDYDEKALVFSGSSRFIINEGAVGVSPSLSVRLGRRESKTSGSEDFSRYTAALNTVFRGLAEAGISGTRNVSPAAANTAYAVSLSYFIARDSGKTLEVKYSVNDYNPVSGVGSYSETVLSAGTSMRF